MKLTRITAIAAVVVLGLVMSQAAFADSIYDLAPTLTADAAFSATGGNWSLTITFFNTGASPATVKQVTLQLFAASNIAPPTFTVASNSGLNGWTSFIDSKGDNGIASTCASPSPANNKGWLCFFGSPLSIASNGSLAFTANGTYATSGLDPNTLDLISNGTTNGETKWAISGGPGGTNVPEPASFGLLAAGLGSFGLFRRKLRK